VQDALGDALCTTCRDPFLNELNVVSVEPAPNTSRLLVTLRLELSHESAAEVAAHLERAAGLLRCEVAAAIHRKKVPELAFRVVTR
jgi:ribosome-binding factor A